MTNETDLQSFMIHWFDGKKEIIHGIDIADACRRACISQGCLPAVDYWEPINTPD